MRKLGVGLLIAWLHLGIAEGASLNGLVKQREVDGLPEPYVQVIAEIGEANSVKTNSAGKFSLEFPKEQPGNKVQLNCLKEGLEVVNRMDLEVILPADPKDVVKLVMCPAAERDTCAVAYYRIALEKVFQQNYDARLKDIEANYQLARENAALKDDALRTKNEAIAKLAEENKSLAAQAQEWAKKFAELSLENTTDEMYKEALQLFQANKLNEALAVLDDGKIEAEEQQKIKAAQAQKANRYVLKAQVYEAQFQFADAETYYQKAIDADPENYDNIFEFGNYLYHQNQFLKAIPVCEDALSLAGDDSNKACTLNNLGTLYKETNQHKKALVAYQQALNK